MVSPYKVRKQNDAFCFPRSHYSYRSKNSRGSTEAKFSVVFDSSAMEDPKLANGFSPRQYPTSSGDTLIDRDSDSLMNGIQNHASVNGVQDVKHSRFQAMAHRR